MSPPAAAERIIDASRMLARSVGSLRFGPPVSFVYNPLEYAAGPWSEYVRRYAHGAQRVLLVGMNPGPWGMVQTGIPFGEVRAVREWLGIRGPVGRPAREHPMRPVEGFACRRSEVSGRRLWGLAQERFGSPEAFFDGRFVTNYCPLAFMADSGRNITPDRLPAVERTPLFALCDEFLRTATLVLGAETVVGVGGFAAARARDALATLDRPPQVGVLLHPSPASPAANRDWAGTATRQLTELGAW